MKITLIVAGAVTGALIIVYLLAGDCGCQGRGMYESNRVKGKQTMQGIGQSLSCIG